ncbi:glycoside hydrolase family 3 protein [Aurantiacibacter sp. MUD61]|uniref:glycoside hydrolase family 3 protein n=1 Tax=Aurantiacibacter sp. MUD61 TaxID=3009083 RepID=UPI0022F12302|nr:glycoside hydrolase family 3 protein [Aurantiacibacter sp. MUD61]
MVRLTYLLALPLLAACASTPEIARNDQPVQADSQAGVANPEIWPSYEYPYPRDPAGEQRIAAIIASMTLEEKVGQIVQADLCCVTPEDVRTYNLGSVLNGGNSGPYGDDLAPASEWLRLADEFYASSTDRSDGGVGIPILWGTDAVHGHSNIIGATLFPHNIGLGAMRDTELVEEIGAVTAVEIRVTGQEWTFAPTVAVPQDFRWGRAYEGYSSDPTLVAEYTGAMVRGLQGPPGNRDLLDGPYVLASTKHYLADGGTDAGIDQGDSSISEIELRDIHGAPYGPAIENGVMTVMASFSSWQGVKMTGNESLLTGVLRDQMGFDGFVVSDWNAHGQVAGCTNEACAQALEAGIDMYMAPDSWRAIYDNTLAGARDGSIEIARIDEAVAAVLRVKLRLGLLDAPAPSDRAFSGEWERLGSAEHRDVARQAVRQSLVLLRNDGILPLAPGGRLLVAGDGADDIARQSGGWTLSWQGTGLTNDLFPGATSIWAGLEEAVTAAGGSAELSPDGSFTQRPDAAVVVFGERPYAEFQGDRASLQLDPELTAPYETMRSLREQDIPVIAVMITGRPLYVNPALNAADAFVVAWLPGSEGGGIADVLVGDSAGNARHDFSGQLPAEWPMTPDLSDGVLYPFGYGLTYTSTAEPWAMLPEIDTSDAAGDSRMWFADGRPASSWSLLVGAAGQTEPLRVTTMPAEAADGRIAVTAIDYGRQEGGRRFTIRDGSAEVALRNFEPIDITRETNADVLLLVTLRMIDAPDASQLLVRGATGSEAIAVDLPETDGFVRYGIPLKCFRDAGADMASLTTPFILATQGAADYAIGEVRLGSDAEQTLTCP